MARGVAKMMGFNLILNFNNPYLSTGLGEFWTRWHISLSSWFRDYVYIPLGGSRGGKFATYRNLFITFLVSGIWHGAAWTFAIWGILHALGVMLTRELERFPFYRERIPALFKQPGSSPCCFAWIFSAPLLEDALLSFAASSRRLGQPAPAALMIALVAAVWLFKFYESAAPSARFGFVRVALRVHDALLCLCSSAADGHLFQF